MQNCRFGSDFKFYKIVFRSLCDELTVWLRVWSYIPQKSPEKYSSEEVIQVKKLHVKLNAKWLNDRIYSSWYLNKHRIILLNHVPYL